MIVNKLKILFASGLLMTMFATAGAQTGIGARGIWGLDGGAYGGLELSIQSIGRFEFDLGWSNDSWKFTGLKLFNLIGGGKFGLYGGFGAGIGYSNLNDEVFGTFAVDLGTYVRLGPIQLGLDWRPEWNVFNAPNSDVSFNLALSARLMFGKSKKKRD